MYRGKRSFLGDYRNVMIMLLILALFFFLGRMLFRQQSLGAEQGAPVSAQVGRLAMGQPEWYQGLFESALQHVFPASRVGGETSATGQLVGRFATGVRSFFDFSSLRNPYTFVRSQFPALALYEQGWAAGEDEPPVVPVEEVDLNEGETEEGVPASAETPPPQQDMDDLGEAGEGIYLPSEGEIIDSLNREGTLNLEQIGLPKKLSFNGEGPHILIYHTHGTESYQPASEGNYHTLKKEFSVIAIGEIMKKELEKMGYQVLHDTTYHDYPSYNGSYIRSLSTAQELMKKYPSIQVIFDIHRDGYEQVAISPNRNSLTDSNQATIQGETTTKFQAVIGSETPNRERIETFARLIKAVSDYYYPGFSKETLVKPYGKFNQYLVDHYALLEVGSNANTIEEAERTAVYLAKVLGEALNQIRE